MKIRAKRTEKNGKVYYTLDGKEKMKLFKEEFEIAYAKQIKSTYGISAFIIAKVPDNVKVVYEDDEGEEHDADNITGLGFSLPIRDKDGTLVGVGEDIIKMMMSRKDGETVKVKVTLNEKTSSQGTKYTVYSVERV